MPTPVAFPITFRAALFDLDGTLVRTFIDFPAMRAAMHALSAAQGTADATAGEEDILEIVRRMAEALGGERGAEIRQVAYEALEAMEAEGCAHPEPIAGAKELLDELRAREVPVGIITRNSRGIAEGLLTRLDLPHTVLIAREDVHEFKPHPEPILRACRALNVAPSDAIMVGDLWADVAAGQAAGVVATFGIQWPHDPPGRFRRCPPTVEVNALSEIAPLLGLPPFGLNELVLPR